MSEFHDDYPQYELMAQHGEEEGKTIRKTLWRVFWYMLAITIFELVIGSMAPGHGWSGTLWLKTLFIGLTILKAGFIVMAFMHLGHEATFFKWIVLLPYAVFISYTIFVLLVEGTYSGYPINKTWSQGMIDNQKKNLEKMGHHATAPAEAHGEEHHEEAHH